MRKLLPLSLAMVTAVALVGCGSNHEETGEGRVPNPIVTPATGGRGQAIGGLRYDVSQFGYEEKEFFFEGTAKTYPPSAPSRSPYRSRMIVWTPRDPSRFNGTTVVEWAEVSDFGLFELTVELNDQSSMLEAQGFAFVLVSVQEDGVGKTSSSSMSLKGADPERYGSLNHPGDAYSFDIFSQALQAIKHPTGTAPLGKLKTRILIAEGFQSSPDKVFVNHAPVPASPSRPFSNYGPLNAYLSSGADEDARLADAFLIDAAAPAVEPANYRVPTLHHLDESAVRWTPTPDSRNHVTWEITGAPHFDRWEGDHISIPSSKSPAPKLTREEELARRDKSDNYGLVWDLGAAFFIPSPKTGSLYPRRFTLNAALLNLRDWVQTGEPAPAAPRIERVSSEPNFPTQKLLRDRDGNAIGGLRSPIIQVPAATYNGVAGVAAGTTTLFPTTRLAQLYPTHESYVRKLLIATNEAVAKRFLVCQDAETIMRKASDSNIGGPDKFTAAPHCVER